MRREFLPIISYIADYIRKMFHKNKTYFIVNKHVNYTNICINRCRLCSFYSKNPTESYTLSIEDILKVVGKYYKLYNISEVHIVGGLNPEIEFEYYEELLRSIKKKFPGITIKAFSAVEIEFFSKRFKMSYEETLSRLKEAGLDMLPGGGAEIFDEEIRKKICPNKLNGEEWLRIHEIAHKMNIKTNATMLYGHVEGIIHRIRHLIKIKKLQEKTGGFVTFIPLKFKPKGTEINVEETSMYDDLFTIAISRIVLTNIKNITAYWVTLGLETSKLATFYGANDLGGTVYEENIIKDKEFGYMNREDFVKIIKKLSQKPIERDSYFNTLREY